jgi:hypothetical protein
MSEKKVLVKIHESYREIVAVCDLDLLGKKFEQGNMEIDINEKFFGGDEFDEAKAIELLKDKVKDDACFNFVGKKAVELGAKAGIIDKDRVLRIDKVPIAMSLV